VTVDQLELAERPQAVAVVKLQNWLLRGTNVKVDVLPVKRNDIRLAQNNTDHEFPWVPDNARRNVFGETEFREEKQNDEVILFSFGRIWWILFLLKRTIVRCDWKLVLMDLTIVSN
jgi:hypothetical protein